MRHFWSDRRGNVAVLFAFAIVPVIGAIGAAVDYSLANSYRTDMQKALDSTALALSKIMPADADRLQEVGMEYFRASLGNHTMTNLNLVITPDQGLVRLRATGDYTPRMANLFGVTQFQIGANAEAKWSLGKLEIALVLDNSGSMSSLGRMTALKAATHDLLNILQSAAREPGDAKVAIVPFDSAVRVNYTYPTAPPWIRFDWWDDNVETCTGWGWSQTCTPEPRTNWVGCVFDRNKSPSVNYDILDTAPNTDPSGPVATKYPAKKCDSNLLPTVLALTENWTALHNKVDAMTPSGWTNITIGMVWGWHLLSPTQIFTEGAAYGTENLTKYIILMTDGDNTRNRFGDSSSTMNSRTSSVCTNIKNAGIKIYSIRLIEGNATLLRNCASDPSMYYDVQQSGQLAGVFSAIGSEIASLHLSR